MVSETRTAKPLAYLTGPPGDLNFPTLSARSLKIPCFQGNASIRSITHPSAYGRRGLPVLDAYWTHRAQPRED